jgi:trypsin-like peptidase
VRTGLCVLSAVLTLSLSPIPGRGAEPAPYESVIMLVTLARDGGAYKSESYGTGFFISADGTALTNSHVVYNAHRSPQQYSLLAVVGKEFYRVAIVCASPLAADPMQQDPAQAGVTPGRDVAEIRLEPSDFPFETWDIPLPGGERLTMATAHTGPLPTFHALPLDGLPRMWEHVRVVGFGHISPIPRVWTAVGTVDDLGTAPDGTPIFILKFSSPARPGNSGSPVLNDQNEVVGMWAWYSPTDPLDGAGISSPALKPACR